MDGQRTLVICHLAIALAVDSTITLTRFRPSKWDKNRTFFSEPFRAGYPLGYPGQNPGFKGHTDLPGPHPFMWKTPTPLKDTRTQKFGFVLLFFSESKVMG